MPGNVWKNFVKMDRGGSTGAERERSRKSAVGGEEGDSDG